MERHCHQRDKSARKPLTSIGYAAKRCSPHAVPHGELIYSRDAEKNPSGTAVQDRLVSGGTFRDRKSPSCIYLVSRALHSISSPFPEKGSVNQFFAGFPGDINHTLHTYT